MQDDPLHLSGQINQPSPLQPPDRKKAPLPAWLLAELGEDDQELYALTPYAHDTAMDERDISPPDQSGYTVQNIDKPIPLPSLPRSRSDEDPQIPNPSPALTTSQRQNQELIQLHAKVKLSPRHSRTRSRHQVTSSQMPSSKQERGGCLTTWLLVQSIGLVLIAYAVLTSAISGQESGSSLVLMLLAGGVAVSLGGLWSLKKWGYYLQMTLYGLSVAFSVLAICGTSSGNSDGTSPFSLWSILGSVIAMVILYQLVHDRWETFR